MQKFEYVANPSDALICRVLLCPFGICQEDYSRNGKNLPDSGLQEKKKLDKTSMYRYNSPDSSQ
jgi:hypothetical protein